MKNHNWKPAWKAQKAMTEHYRELFDSLIGEIRFEKMRADSLLQEMREIVTMTNDPLAKKVAETSIERYELDGTIHARLIFGNK